jgi:hypothetical protein
MRRSAMSEGNVDGGNRTTGNDNPHRAHEHRLRVAQTHLVATGRKTSVGIPPTLVMPHFRICQSLLAALHIPAPRQGRGAIVLSYTGPRHAAVGSAANSGPLCVNSHDFFLKVL